jgi:hypothetical protein
MGVMALGGHFAWGQAPSGGGNVPQIPFGQTYKDFQFPMYQKGQLAYTLTAVSARGITINRAEAKDVKIDLYTDGKVTTTITSPDADLYLADRKMRSKNTVQIERADLEATAQVCDFDLGEKKYLLRQNVRVLLKHFDVGASPKTVTPPATTGVSPTAPAVPPAPEPMPTLDEPPPPPPSGTRTSRTGESLLDVPGASASPSTAPIQPPPQGSP